MLSSEYKVFNKNKVNYTIFLITSVLDKLIKPAIRILKSFK